MNLPEALSAHRESLARLGDRSLSERTKYTYYFAFSGLAIMGCLTASAPLFWICFAKEKRVWRIRNPVKSHQYLHTAMSLQAVAVLGLIFNVTRYGPLERIKAKEKEAALADALVWDISVWIVEWEKRPSRRLAASAVSVTPPQRASFSFWKEVPKASSALPLITEQQQQLEKELWALGEEIKRRCGAIFSPV